MATAQLTIPIHHVMNDFQHSRLMLELDNHADREALRLKYGHEFRHPLHELILIKTVLTS